ncbi:MAG: heavy metal-binding domain-containing protein [Bacteroidota bacterium]|nr:heavy metal-binding domain-containing protein [Bacteroidota bacterium]
MKKLIILSTFIAAAMSILPSCNSKQTVDDYLKDDTQRKEVTTAIIHNPAYHAELMQVMMNSDSTKQMMGEGMMKDPAMMNMMMENMMNMADKDTAMCKKMMNMMEQKPMMMKMMKEMNMTAGTMYTCPMHPEVKSATPGKCPKCGMDLVKMKESKTMDDSKMKMQ